MPALAVFVHHWWLSWKRVFTKIFICRIFFTKKIRLWWFLPFIFYEGSGDPNNQPHLKVINSNPCYKELFKAQQHLEDGSDYCDVHLITQEGHIPVHRAFLQGKSDFLDEIIKENLRVSQLIK